MGADLDLVAMIGRALALNAPLLAELEHRLDPVTLSEASDGRLQVLGGMSAKLQRAAAPMARVLVAAMEAQRKAGAKLSRAEKAVLFVEWAGKELEDGELLSTVQALTQALNDRRVEVAR